MVLRPMATYIYNSVPIGLWFYFYWSFDTPKMQGHYPVGALGGVQVHDIVPDIAGDWLLARGSFLTRTRQLAG
jgi:hypothetical protein